LGHDAVLFGEGWEGNENLCQYFEIDVLLGRRWRELQEVRLRGSDEILEIPRILKHGRRNKPDNAIREAGVKAQYPAIRDVRGNRDAKRTLWPFDALGQPEVIILARIGLDDAL